MMIQFATFTPEEMPHVEVILTRAVGLFDAHGLFRSRMECFMDLSAAHAVCPLDLEALAGFDLGDFAHDIGGLNQHLNRDTGEMMNCFLPRCARPEVTG